GGVDQKGALLHSPQALPVDHSFRLRNERTVKGYNIRFFENFIHFSPLEIGPVGLIRPVSPVAQNLHSEGIGNVCDLLANGSESDDSDCFARNFDQRIVPEAEIGRVRPPAFPNQIAVPLGPVTELQYKREGKLRNRIGAVTGYVGDG